MAYETRVPAAAQQKFAKGKESGRFFEKKLRKKHLLLSAPGTGQTQIIMVREGRQSPPFLFVYNSFAPTLLNRPQVFVAPHATMIHASTMDNLPVLPPSQPAQTELCANCGALRVGPWCHACGQHMEATHRSVRRLGVEAFEHLINTDGKILSTLKQLFAHPARLTKAYLEGHRVAQVAPINLFLVILVLFLFIAGQTTHLVIEIPSPAQAAAIPHFMRWTIPISSVLQKRQSTFTSNLNESAELFGLLTVPVAALLLWGLFAVPRRGIRLFDHLIFSLHSLSFQFIMLSLLSLLPDFLGFLTLPIWGVMAAHLFFHMRGTYGSGAGATLVRMALLGAGTFVASLALVALWMSVAYAELWI